MLVARTLAPEPGQRVLDLCAAPGGKTTHLAALMAGIGELLAVELSATRARALERTVARMHTDNVRIAVADATAPAAWAEPGSSGAGAFDRVLVDPPCTGLGTLQARPDLRWRVKEEAIEQMRSRQAGILTAGADALRPGGVLVYSTCTVSPIENERLIAAFLHSRPDFVLDDLTSEHPDLAFPGAAEDLDAVQSRTLLTLPHRDRTAGFFIARLRRG
jgi:16S rRNA (cytosine967-C5)-methyltransferase